MQGTGLEAVATPASLSRRVGPVSGILLSVALLAIAAAALLLLLRTTGPTLSWDSKDYAQVARQIARGQGMTSKLAVRELLEFEGPSPQNWPNLIRPPVPVYLLAFTFRFLGARDAAVPVWASCFFLATVVVTFWAFQPLFGTAIAFVAATAFALSPSGMLYATSGLSESSAMFFLALAFLGLIRCRPVAGAAIIGLSMGACALTRPIAYLWVIILAAGFLWRCRRQGERWIVPGVLLAACFLIPVLVVAHAVHWQGGRALLAINLALRTGADPAGAVRSPIGFVLHHPSAMAKKMIIEFARPVVYGFRFGSVLLFSALGIFGLAMRWTDPRQRLARALVIALLLTSALALCMLTEGDAYAGPLRYFDVFAPLIVPWGVAVLWMVRSHVPRLAFAALLAVMLLGGAVQVTRDPSFKPKPEYAAMYRQMGSIVPESDVIAAGIATEAPAIAWYADRYVVWPCEPPQEAWELRRRGLPVRWYFARADSVVPPAFHLVQSWPTGYRLWDIAP
jgi:4-amino-4-deoxy-L-arabinose transferase-like glycosyltransferase